MNLLPPLSWLYARLTSAGNSNESAIDNELKKKITAMRTVASVTPGNMLEDLCSYTKTEDMVDALERRYHLLKDDPYTRNLILQSSAFKEKTVHPHAVKGTLLSTLTSALVQFDANYRRCYGDTPETELEIKLLTSRWKRAADGIKADMYLGLIFV